MVSKEHDTKAVEAIRYIVGSDNNDKIVQFTHLQQASRELTVKVRRRLGELDIPLPARVISPLFVANGGEQGSTVPGIDDLGDLTWLVESSKPECPPHVVQHKDDGWTCSCKAWKKHRWVDCSHIKLVRSLKDDSSGTYACARRVWGSRIIYPEGSRSELTRRADAAQKWPERAPLLAAILCGAIEEPLPRKKSGRPPVSLKAIIYALLIKAIFAVSYDATIAFLRKDALAERLGIPESISKNSLSKWNADPTLTPVLKGLLQRTARVGHKIETTLLIDATGRASSPSGDWLEAKHGRKSRVRKPSKYTKEHVVVGRQTGLVAALEMSLDRCVGSADVIHLRTAVPTAMDAFPGAKMIIGDKSYGPKNLFEWCEQRGLLLVTRAKSGEKRKGEKWPKSAQQLALFEQEQPKQFAAIYNPRNVVESVPSRSKRRNRHRRLRRRWNDVQVTLAASDEEREIVVSALPIAELTEIVNRQEQAVGVAPLNEGYAFYISDNLHTIVTLEQLYDSEVSLLSGSFGFEPIPTLWLDENLDPVEDIGAALEHLLKMVA